MFSWLRSKLLRGLVTAVVGITLLPWSLALPLAVPDEDCPAHASHAAAVAVSPDASGQAASSDGCAAPLMLDGPCSGSDCSGVCAALPMSAMPPAADTLAQQQAAAVPHDGYGRSAPPETPPPIG